LPGLGPGPAVGLLLQQAAPAVSGGASLASSAFAFDLLRTSLALVGVCLCALIALRFLSRRGFGPLLLGVGGGATGSAGLRIVQRLPLEPRKALYVVALGKRRLLIATGESGAPRLLAELEPDAEGATDASRGPEA
jgi:hypothetical protein